MSIGLANPIPRALAHYETELEETLNRLGELTQSTHLPSIEGVGGLGRARVLLDLLRAPRSVGQGEDPVVVMWPSLGLLEPWLWRSARRPVVIVVHDPEPLRSQLGFGSISRTIARSRLSDRPIVMSHSDEATAVLQRMLPRNRLVQVGHPILSEQRFSTKSPGLVVVAGQYKPVRDLEMLGQLGPLLRRHGYEPRIVGSGWPDVEGWDVDARFVSEDELDSNLGSAEIVLLPYRRYFQSGITIRALERGTLTVGPRTSFAESVFGVDSPLLVDPIAGAHAWLEAISSATGQSSVAAHSKYVAECDISWGTFLADYR